MDDLTVDFDDWRLNCRAGGIIIHNNKVLLHHDISTSHYAIVGGRIKIGESSAETVKREIKEEIGKDVEVTGYVSTIENFFEMKNKKYHEYFFVHFAEFVNEEDKKIEQTLSNLEGREKLKYYWVDIKDIDNIDLRPSIMKSILKEKKFPMHYIVK